MRCCLGSRSYAVKPDERCNLRLFQALYCKVTAVRNLLDSLPTVIAQIIARDNDRVPAHSPWQFR